MEMEDSESRDELAAFVAAYDRAESTYGPLLDYGLIVRVASPEIDFGEAVEAGPDHADANFDAMLTGLRVGHASEFRALGLFERLRDRVGIDVDIGSWIEVPAPDLHHLIEAVDEIHARATPGVGNLLDDIRELAKSARARGCSMGFLF